MEATISFLPILFIMLIGCGFAYCYIGGKIRAPIEAGLKPIFEEQAGGRFDEFNLTVPFVRHSIYEEFVVISYGNTKYILNFSEITKVTYTKYVLSKCLIYRHNNRAGLPVECIVWSGNCLKAIEALGSRGVTIQRYA